MTDDTQPTPVPIGVLTVSDRAHAGTYEDRGGPATEKWLSDVLTTAWRPEYRVVPDDQQLIESALTDLIDTRGCALVCVTGGTGPSPRDVTPEAVAAVCDRILPGFGEEMRRASLRVVPTAILSRQEAGLRGTSLIIALPGNPGAISDCLEAVFAAVPYAIELAGGPILETDPTRIPAFRPRHARPRTPQQ
ncbi:MAG: molybdopterin adenylyltransferase [Alkalispirochaeta sp.]